MAKAKGALLSIEANGKCGDIIVYRNQHGQIIRPVPVYVDPETEQQTNWRDALSYLSGQWRTSSTITTPLRDMWRDFALIWPSSDRFGKQIHLTARDWFIRLNIFRRMAGLGYHKAPPKYPSCSIEPGVTFSLEDQGIMVDVDTALFGDDLLYIACVPEQNLSRFFMPRTGTTEFFIKSSDTFPYCLIQNKDLSTDTTRYFFRYRPVDGSGRAAPARITYVDAIKKSFNVNISESLCNLINSVNPDTNYNNLTYNYVINTIDPIIQRSLVFFDLSSIPSWATIVTASLSYYSDSASFSGNLNLHNIVQEYSNSQCTYNIAYTGLPWSSPGMAAPNDFDSTPIDSLTDIGSSKWYEFNVKDWVQSIIDEDTENLGLVLIFPSSGDFIQLFSHLNADTDHRPVLSISYE